MIVSSTYFESGTYHVGFRKYDGLNTAYDICIENANYSLPPHYIQIINYCTRDMWNLLMNVEEILNDMGIKPKMGMIFYPNDKKGSVNDLETARILATEIHPELFIKMKQPEKF